MSKVTYVMQNHHLHDDVKSHIRALSALDSEFVLIPACMR